MNNWFVFSCDGYRITYVAPNPDNEQGTPFTPALAQAQHFTQDEADVLVNVLREGGGTYGYAKFK